MCLGCRCSCLLEAMRGVCHGWGSEDGRNATNFVRKLTQMFEQLRRIAVGTREGGSEYRELQAVGLQVRTERITQ